MPHLKRTGHSAWYAFDMGKKPFCERAQKPCRTKEGAANKVARVSEYRRAYKCEFCDYWHITSRLPREYTAAHEIEERDYC